jgi:putative intracellular protease/amidase
LSKVLIPVPSYGFDPTEVAIPWKLLSQNDHDVIFATPDGQKASPDNCMLTGDGLGIWKSTLSARQDAVAACLEMDGDAAFCNPLKYADLEEVDFDAIYLPGGHDKRIKDFLESPLLQRLVAEFFAAQKPVAAICHGVVLAARSKNRETGKSVIYDYKTTALLKTQERLAYNMTRLWMQDYYLTYPDMTVEDEVRAALSDGGNFVSGPQPILRDSMDHLGRGFVVKDRNYLSARWPGDVYNISVRFEEMLN